MTVYRTTTRASLLLCLSLILGSEPTLGSEPQFNRVELQQRLLNALSGEFSNFYALTEHPTTVGDFPPVLQRADIITLANGEQALLVEQGFLAMRAAHASTKDVGVVNSYRRQLYAFVTPRNSNQLVHVSYPLPDSIGVTQLAAPNALESLKRLPGCEVHWHYERLVDGSDSFEGYRSPERCFFIDDNNTPVHMETILHVANYGIQMTDNVLDASGEPLLETELGGTMLLNPIRFFNMTVSFLPDGADKNNADAWISIQPDGLIHDHGQRINLLTKKEQQILPYQIQLLREEDTNDRLQVRIYSLGSEMPLEQLSLELENGVGVLQVDPLRVEIHMQP